MFSSGTDTDDFPDNTPNRFTNYISTQANALGNLQGLALVEFHCSPATKGFVTNAIFQNVSFSHDFGFAALEMSTIDVDPSWLDPLRELELYQLTDDLVDNALLNSNFLDNFKINTEIRPAQFITNTYPWSGGINLLPRLLPPAELPNPDDYLTSAYASVPTNTKILVYHPKDAVLKAGPTQSFGFTFTINDNLNNSRTFQRKVNIRRATFFNQGTTQDYPYAAFPLAWDINEFRADAPSGPDWISDEKDPFIRFFLERLESVHEPLAKKQKLNPKNTLRPSVRAPGTSERWIQILSDRLEVSYVAGGHASPILKFFRADLEPESVDVNIPLASVASKRFNSRQFRTITFELYDGSGRLIPKFNTGERFIVTLRCRFL